MTEATTKTKPQQVSGDERGFRVWLVWAIVLLTGFVAWLILDHLNDKQMLSIVKTQSVVERLQSSTLAMSSEAVQAVYGSSASFDKLSQLKTMMQNDLSTLQRGGVTEDQIQTLALSTMPSIPLPALTTHIQGFDRATQSILGTSEILRRAADAETQMPLLIEQMIKESADIAQIPRFNQAPWAATLAPIRRDLTLKELSSMPVVFAPAPGDQVLAKGWAQLLATRAQELEQVSNIAQRDQTLSSREKALMAQWAKTTKDLSSAMQVLLATNQERYNARQALASIRASGALVDEASKNLIRSLQNMSKEQNIMLYSVWGAIAVSWIGFFGVLRSLWVMGYMRWRAVQDGQKGLAMSDSVDKASRDLRKILARESVSDRLLENPNSPIFALVSSVNQLLAQRDAAADVVSEQSREFKRIIFELDGNASSANQANQDQKRILGGVTGKTRNSAEQIAALAQDFSDLFERIKYSLEQSYKGGGLVQENSWRMESLRENAQGTSKRVKRLGETAQSVSTSADTIKDISRKVKVLALNIAVEAAAHGESGAPFASLARELERLAQSIDDVLKDINAQIVSIQTDAKDTVAALEESTADVVESAKLLIGSGAVYKDLDRGLEKSRDQLSELIGQVEKAALDVHAESEQAELAMKNFEKQDEQIQLFRQTIGRVRSGVEEFRKWLISLGRDI